MYTLSEIRKSKGLSQAEAAEGVGINTVQLSKLENGHHKPYPSTIAKLAAFYGITRESVVESIKATHEQTHTSSAVSTEGAA